MRSITSVRACLIVTSCIISIASITYSITNTNDQRKSDKRTIPSGAEKKKKRPNILLILGDDIGTGDVPGYWNTNMVHMPNLQELMDKGVKFTDAHSTPLCAPSRYMLLSGNYPHRGRRFGGTFHLNYQANQFHDGQLSIAHVLRDAGYHTAMFGKWHLGGKVPTVEGFNTPREYRVEDARNILQNALHDWTQPLEGGPLDVGFEYSSMVPDGVARAPFAFVRNNMLVPNKTQIKYWHGGTYEMPHGDSMIAEGNKEGDGDVDWDSTALNMIVVNETTAFLDRHLEGDRSDDPFFAYAALSAVHIPHSPPDKYMDGTPIAGQYPSKHMDLLGEVDKVIGSLVQALTDRQLLEDTIIIFASDNGGLNTKKKRSKHYDSSGELRGSKSHIYEGGHRIPMVMRWDGGSFPANETRSHIVGLNDVFATLSDLAGAKVPEGQAMDSVSFADYILHENNQSGLREYLGTWAYSTKSSTEGKLKHESIRKNNMKLIRDFIGGRFQLFDLDSDVTESPDSDLSKEERYQPLIQEMYSKLKEIGPCYDNNKQFNVEKNGQTMRRSCAWFQKTKTQDRCSMYKEGRKECRFTCMSYLMECVTEQESKENELLDTE